MKYQTKTNGHFLSSVRQHIPEAVLIISFSPTAEEDVPPTLLEIANAVLEKNAGASEEELARLFSQKLSFNDSYIKELEKGTRNQSGQNLWKEQRKDRITASNFHDVYTKVKTLQRERGESVKTQVTPMLARLLEHTDLSAIPAISWGRPHEDASAAFLLKKA